MTIQVAPVVSDDLTQISAFCYKSFAMGGDMFKTVIFNPLGDTPSGEEFARRYFLDDLARNDPQVHYVKAVDDATGDIVACAVFTIYDKNPFEGSSDKRTEATWLEGKGYDQQKEYAEELMATSTAARRSIKELHRPHCYVRLLFTDPRHHRRGAGSAVLQWGTKQADKERMPCVVEASIYAHQYNFYARHGFQEVKHQAVNADRKWPDLPIAKCVIMYRPAPDEEWKGPE